MEAATKSWKTTLGGILMTAGTLLSQGEGLYQTVGMIMVAVGGLLMGVAAKDG